MRLAHGEDGAADRSLVERVRQDRLPRHVLRHICRDGRQRQRAQVGDEVSIGRLADGLVVGAGHGQETRAAGLVDVRIGNSRVDEGMGGCTGAHAGVDRTHVARQDMGSYGCSANSDSYDQAGWGVKIPDRPPGSSPTAT